MRTMTGTIAMLAWLAASSDASAQSPPKLDPYAQGLKEFTDPGSTAIGQPIDVLAPWGAPSKTAQLGKVVIYTWIFLEDSGSSRASYSGTVTPQGSVSLNEHKSDPVGCEITVQTDADGTITTVTNRKFGVTFCKLPVRWWEKR